MASTLPDAVLADRATDFVSFGEGGAGLRGGIEQSLDAPLEEDDEDLE